MTVSVIALPGWSACPGFLPLPGSTQADQGHQAEAVHLGWGLGHLLKPAGLLSLALSLPAAEPFFFVCFI